MSGSSKHFDQTQGIAFSVFVTLFTFKVPLNVTSHSVRGEGGARAPIAFTQATVINCNHQCRYYDLCVETNASLIPLLKEGLFLFISGCPSMHTHMCRCPQRPSDPLELK